MMSLLSSIANCAAGLVLVTISSATFAGGFVYMNNGATCVQSGSYIECPPSPATPAPQPSQPSSLDREVAAALAETDRAAAMAQGEQMGRRRAAQEMQQRARDDQNREFAIRQQQKMDIERQERDARLENLSTTAHPISKNQKICKKIAADGTPVFEQC